MRKNNILLLLAVILLSPTFYRASPVYKNGDTLSVTGYAVISVDRKAAKAIKNNTTDEKRKKKVLIDFDAEIFFMNTGTNESQTPQIRDIAFTAMNQKDSVYILLRPQAYLELLTIFCFNDQPQILIRASSLPLTGFRKIKGLPTFKGKRVVIYKIEGDFLVWKVDECVKNLLEGSFMENSNYAYLLIPIDYRYIQLL
ncbi:MAG: hypothetical protein R3C61_08290 [Bacteroidia bacterium]